MSEILTNELACPACSRRLMQLVEHASLLGMKARTWRCTGERTIAASSTEWSIMAHSCDDMGTAEIATVTYSCPGERRLDGSPL